MGQRQVRHRRFRLGDLLFEALGPEAFQVLGAPQPPGGHRVQISFHRGGEVLGDQVRHLAGQVGGDQQADGADGEAVPDGHGVGAPFQGGDQGLVGAGSADARRLEGVDQGALRVTRGGRGLFVFRFAGGEAELLPLVQFGKLGVVLVTLRAGLGQGQEARLEQHLALGFQVGHAGAEGDGGAGEDRVLHLRGHAAVVDQGVDRQVVAFEVGGVRGAEARPGGPDRLVRFLGVLVPCGVLAGPGGQRAFAEQPHHLGAGGQQRLFGERGRIGAHVGDVALFVQLLRDLHDAADVQADAPRGLLQGGGDERWRGAGGAFFGLHAADGGGGLAQRRSHGAGLFRGQREHVRALFQHTLAAVVAGFGERLALRVLPGADRDHRGGEGRRGVRVGAQHPVARRDETHAGHLAGGDQHQGGALHAPGAQRLPLVGLALDAAPQQRAEAVAHQPVDDAPGFLRGDQVHVQRAGPFHRLLQGVLGDLGKGDALRVLQSRHLGDVPGDGLPLAVGVHRQQHPVGAGRETPDLGDHVALVFVDDVDGPEGAGFDAHRRPRLVFVLVGNRVVAVGQVTDVADAGDHGVARPEVLLDGAGFAGGLDDDQGAQGGGLLQGRRSSRRLRPRRS